jgi:hypothetical protein
MIFAFSIASNEEENMQIKIAATQPIALILVFRQNIFTDFFMYVRILKEQSSPIKKLSPSLLIDSGIHMYVYAC